MTHGGRSKQWKLFFFLFTYFISMWRLVRNFLKKTNAKISVIGDLIRQTHLVAKVENERVNYTKKASIVHIEGKCH